MKPQSDLVAGVIGYVKDLKINRQVVPTMASLPECFDDRAVVVDRKVRRRTCTRTLSAFSASP